MQNFDYTGLASVMMQIEKGNEIYNFIQFRNSMDMIIDFCKNIRYYCKNHDMLNEQWYLDWEDQLNVISVADPNN